MANPFDTAKHQLKSIVDVLRTDYDDANRFNKAVEILSNPDNVHKSTLEITLDNGKKAEFPAFRSQHNNARGPYKGGVRFHHDVTEDEIKAFSIWMTIKCAVVGIPYGGGKGGIVVSPQTLTTNELERLSRAYIAFLAPSIGPWKDIPAPDVNTNSQTMAWFLDEYEKIVNQHAPAAFTGKPLELGGSEGRTEATGQGGVNVLHEYAKSKGLDPTDTTLAIQGSGNVGFWFAKLAMDLGYKVVALSDSSGAIYDMQGIDPDHLLKQKREHGSLAKVAQNENSEFITNVEMLKLEVDVFVPSALENAITKDNAHDIKAKVIVEMANGPTTPDAEDILFEKGIDVLPDVLCNAGGVTVSYFEWVQNLHGYRWTKDKVNSELENIMVTAFDEVHEQKSKRNVSYRQAAYILAVRRIIDAMILRGRV